MALFFPWKRPELAIDFGTANLRVIRRGEGVVFDEPSLCCFADLDTMPSLAAAGAEALEMLDRTPGRLAVRRPLHRGVLQDIGTATHLLRYAVRRALGHQRIGAANVMVGVPADATQAEQRAMVTAARDAGLGAVRLVSEPFTAAIGADLPVDAPSGRMIVECGAGTTDVAVLSLGGICVTRSARGGGASLDQAITDHIHFRHKFLIGERTAERIKREHARLRGNGSRASETIEIKGRSLVSRKPASLKITLGELDRVAERHAGQIVDIIRDVLNQTPPELSHDIHAHGIMLTGGSALTPRLREMIAADTGLSVTVAEKPEHCVAKGLHRMLLG